MRILFFALILLSAQGCLSIPDGVRAEFAPPDGIRPDNYRPHCDAAKEGEKEDR